MAQKLNPWSGTPFVDANGDPYAGAQLFVYTAGSATKATTTKDLAGASNHANPIILNSAGQIADGSGVAQAMWQTEGATLKLVLAPSTDTDPPIAAIDTFDDIPGINDTTTTSSEWISAQTPTFVSTTTFTVAGDHTSTYHFGRRVECTQTSGTEYGTIVTSVFTALTTITVIMDGGTNLDSGLSQVNVGLLTVTNESIPNTTSLTQRWAKGTDLASATALPDSPDGNYADVTGTTTITSILTTGKVGTVIKRQFDGALILTHHATDLILPGGANITTAAGDEVEFVEYASGDYRCTNYTAATGKAVVETGITLGTSVASTSGTEIDFTSIPSGVKKITITLKGVSTNGTSNKLIQIGDAGGIETSGYLGASSFHAVASVATSNYTAGFGIKSATASNIHHGAITLYLHDSLDWVCSGDVALSDTTGTFTLAGSKTLSAELDRVRITTVNGTDAFDAGEINIQYGL